MLNFNEPDNLYPIRTNTLLNSVDPDLFLSRKQRYYNNLSRFNQDCGAKYGHRTNRDYGLMFIAPRGPGI